MAILWEWGRAKDPAVLWTTSSDWHGGMFLAEKEALKLSSYELFPIPSEKVFDLCWDQLYIQKASVGAFVEKHAGRPLDSNLIEGTGDMVFIESAHCVNRSR